MNFCCSFSHLFWQLKNPGGLGSGIFQFLSVHSFFFFLSSNYTNSYSKKVNIIKLSYLCCVCVCVFWVLNMIFFFDGFFFSFLIVFVCCVPPEKTEGGISAMFGTSCFRWFERKRRFSFDFDDSLSQQGWWLLFKLNCIPLDLTVKLYPLLRQIRI